MDCIGHVQKRVGSRLRKLNNKSKGVKLADGKGLAGKGKLTDGKIDVLQNYYGLAIRENLTVQAVDHTISFQNMYSLLNLTDWFMRYHVTKSEQLRTN